MKFIEITYNELVRLRDGHQLIPNKSYRITDYVTTTTQTDTIADDHRFDVIVRAIDEMHLSEEARVCKHDGEDYFDSVKLYAWKIMYSLDNNKELYKWADPVNGKGVIYNMVDEFNNMCPYDFANIRFKRTKEWFDEHNRWCEAVMGFVPETDLYFYTFTWVTERKELLNLITFGHKMKNETGGVSGVCNNYINSCNDPNTNNLYKLNNNVFISSEYWCNGVFNGLYGNTLKSNCQHNTFGNECQYNILYNNCYNNTFGNHCQSNKLMTDCHDNIFKSSSYSNSLGCGCEQIVLRNSTYNTFGPECSNIVAMMGIHCNTFGSYCQNIKCGDSKLDSSKSFKFNIFENNVRYVDITASKSFSTGSLQNVTICQGVRGYKDDHLKLVIPVVNQNYQIKVAYSSNGDLKIYCEADLIK